MKAELTIEESDKLIELGVDKKYAELKITHYEDKPTEIKRVFTLTNILSIIPKEIEYDGLTYGLNFWVDSAVWNVEYCAEKGVYDFLINSNIDAPELIDALYQLLIWAIENGYVNQNNESK